MYEFICERKRVVDCSIVWKSRQRLRMERRENKIDFIPFQLRKHTAQSLRKNWVGGFIHQQFRFQMKVTVLNYK